MKIYEVIRVINSNVLFLSDHIDRLRDSLIFYKKVSLNMNEIYNSIFNIIHFAENKSFNIRIEIDIDTLEYTFTKVKGRYPKNRMYKSGVDILTYKYKRDNPNIKLDTSELKAITEKLKIKKRVYELLYVNNSKVYECTTSNIFFIKGNKVYTPPVKDVLSGVTRMKVIDICSELGYEVIEADLYLKDINKMSACFITGTSKDVLPVRKINLKKYNPKNKILRKIMDSYKLLVEEDME